MSHLLQRKEKDCLNCGAVVIGKFCHNCGQENVEPKESVWHFVNHFINDVTHFDGKFFTTLKDLLFKPGYLSKEYMHGKRVKYLNPVRMYLFTSFIFFLIFFSLYHIDEKKINDNTDYTFGVTPAMADTMSPQRFEAFTKRINHGKALGKEEFVPFIDSVKKSEGFHFTNHKYKSRAEYDSVLKTGVKKHNWLERKLIYKEIDINEKYGNDTAKILSGIISALMHSFPQMLFISLPLVALFFKLLYVRRKQFYYVSHAIFTIHFYIFVFIVMLATIGISKLQNFTEWNWLGYINGLLSLIIFFYLYKAMRNFYQQRRAKTIIKYVLFLFSFLFLIMLLLVAFFFVSIFQA